MFNSLIGTRIRGAAVWASLLFPPCVWAADSSGIEEIVVTAQKREQSLQDIPVAVTALSGEALAMSGAQTIEDIQALAPSLTVTSINTPGTSTQIQMRGVGTSTTNVGLEAAVGFFLDGVYRSRSGMAVGDLLDVERVEVLRGPQGTVFGKNTSAGAISVITHEPTFETTAFGQLDLGDYDARHIQGVWNTPIVDERLALRVSASQNVRDGYVDDLVSGNDYNDLDRWSTRAQLLWQPAEHVDVRVIADRAEQSETSIVGARAVNGPLDAALFAPLAAANGGLIVNPARPFARETALNDGAESEVEDSGVSMQIDYGASFGDVTAIVAWRSYDSQSNKDVDFSSLDFFRTEFDFREDFFSAELRATGDIEQPGPLHAIQWLTGVFYSDEEIESRANFPTQGQLPLFLSITANALGIPLAPSDFANGEDTGVFQDRGLEGTTYAAFGQVTFELTERFGFTGGLRYSREQKDNWLSDETIAGPGNILLGIFAPAPDFDDLSFDEDQVTGDASVQFKWTDDLMSYAKYARGYKSGGVNIDAGGAGSFGVPADPTFDSEFSNSWELGLRSTWFDGHWVMNVTAFTTEFEDFQVQSFNGVSFLLSNAAGVESQGVELETEIRPLAGLSISAGVTYADATFDDGVTTGFTPVGGERLPMSSEWTGSLAGTYERAIPGTSLNGFLHLELLSRSETNLDSSTLDPLADQDGYSLVNARVGLGRDTGRWNLALWCRNCADEDYAIFTFASPFQAGSFDSVLGQPRMWGVSITGSL